jgi:hypothetical protein
MIVIHQTMNPSLGLKTPARSHAFHPPIHPFMHPTFPHNPPPTTHSSTKEYIIIIIIHQTMTARIPQSKQIHLTGPPSLPVLAEKEILPQCRQCMSGSSTGVVGICSGFSCAAAAAAAAEAGFKVAVVFRDRALRAEAGRGGGGMLLLP